LKLKVGYRPLAHDAARVAALREAAPDAGLRLDANGAWGGESLGAAEALARFEPEVLEEPCRGLDALRRLQSLTGVPIAADESLPPLADLHRHLPLGTSAAVLKPSALGGPSAVVAAAAALADSGTAAIVGSFLESAVGVAAAAHVAAAAGGPPAGLATSAMLQDDVCEPLRVTDGAVRLPAASGLGLAPDPGRLARVRDGGNGG
ncbi:MAG: o-succinylbenzoate synthase, partial [bacterium]|nr:o-succinylbenzoate synthase [bacterium]